MKKYLAIIGMWLFMPLAIFGFPRDIPAFTCLAILLFPLLAVMLIIGFLTLFLFGRRKPQAVLAMVLAMTIGTLGFFKGFIWGARIHLLVNEDRYAEKIRELYTARSSEEKDKICGNDCLVSTSQPPRVTFHFCHCPFYWPDIVYDPAGTLHGTDRDTLRKLDFYLHDAQHLSSFWYIGYFGD